MYLSKSILSSALITTGTVVLLSACNLQTVTNLNTNGAMMEKSNANAMMEKTDSDAMMESNSNSAMMEGEKKEGDAMMQDDKQGTASENKGTDTAMQKQETTMAKENETMTVGTYEDYTPAKLALAKTGKVVLFFKASWCPTCRALDADINAHLGDIPAGVHILKVDYDTSAELKSKYGITYQHTFVEVDSSGTQLKKWSGSPTLKDLVSQL